METNPARWPQTTISAVLGNSGSIKTGPFGTTLKAAEYSQEGVPVISVGEVGDGKLRLHERTPRVNTETTARLPEYILKAGDIVFGRKGAVERSAWVKTEQSGWFLGSDGIRLRLPESIDSRFIAYCFQTEYHKSWMLTNCVGTTMHSLNQGVIERIPIPLPPLPIQREIAAILSAFDDKIELNRQMNRTLEAMARALFQSWFVDFDPVRAKMRGEQPEGMDAETAALFPDELEVVEGREVPKGWEWVAFGSLIQVLGGGTPKTSNSDFWEGTIPWYSVVDVPNDGDVWVLDTSKHITEAGLANSPTKLLPVGTTIISARGTVGKLALTAGPMTMNQSCYGLFPRDETSIYFTYLSTQHAIHELKGKVHGAVFDTITKETLSTVFSILPSLSVSDAFEEASGDLMFQILGNLRESAHLSTLRDALLPRLLSGEVDVSGWAEMSREALEMV